MGRYLCFLLAIVIGACGCSRSDNPMSGHDDHSEAVNNVSPAAPGVVEFSDDFEAGLDPAVWYREILGQGAWTHAVEGGNGYIYSPPEVTLDWGNRMVDILTYRDDFSDFTVTWDMRFHTQSWHQDHRYLYFRSDDQPNPLGYVVNVGVWIPTIPDHLLQILRFNPDGTADRLHPAYVPYPFTLEEWYSFELSVAGNQFNLKVWKRGDPKPEDWTIEAVDPNATYASGRIGFGDYWNSITDADNVVVTLPVIPVSLDIKPGSCPNPLNVLDRPEAAKVKKGGILPVAILGKGDFNVEDIDISSLMLEGIAPIRHAYEDVASPAVSEECQCVALGADGYMDLTLKFDKTEIGAALGAVSDGQTVSLTVTGRLLDGTAITGVDCVWIIR